MSEPAPAGGDRLLVALRGGCVVLRVEGRGSFKLSGPLKEAVASAVAGGARAVVCDLADCVGMDSTFMGVLAGVALRLRREAAAARRVVLLNLSPKTAGLLATLGLDRLIDAFCSGATPPEWAGLLSAPAPLRAVEETVAQAAARSETMLEAHETLVEAAPENLARFRDVLEFLREDVRRGGAKGGVP